MSINCKLARRIRRSFSFLACFALVCAHTLIAQAEQTHRDQTKKQFLWSIQKDGKTIYVLGSIHVLKSDYDPPPGAVESAYETCKAVVFETDIDGASSPEMQAKMLALGLYPDGETLKDNVSEQTHELLMKKAAEVGLPAPHLERFRPWFCALTLSVLELHRLGFREEFGLDKYFFNRCKKDGKGIKTLETIEYQFGLFALMDNRQQEAFLTQTLKDLEVMETLAPDMLEAWEEGDAERLNSIMQMSFEDHPDLYELLVAQRNRRWISQIEDMMEDHNEILVVVGAGHLVGVDNLRSIFQSKGYTVEQR